MKDQKAGKGSLFLIPAALGEEGTHVIPEYVKKQVYELDIFIVENERSARRYLRSIGYEKDFNKVRLLPLGKHTDPVDTIHYLDEAERGNSIGLLSEAGAPGVADPGAEIVRMAHAKKVRVVPLVGPSSILLALMAAGFNGQSFTFHGYLPIDKKERSRVLKSLEMRSLTENQTQIFMEAPYRNSKLLEDVLQVCHGDTLLSIAANVTLPNEMIRTRTIADWKKHKPDLHKKPSIFCLYKQ